MVRGLRRAFHRIKETVSAYAKNGHDVAILEKKVQNSMPVFTKSERMQVKMDIKKHQEAKISKIKLLYWRKCKRLCREWT